MHEESGPSWGMRGLRKWLGTAPETRDELLKLVQDSRRFLEPDTVAMLEGVLDLPATKIREVMTPRTAMISLQEDDELLDILHVLVESAHSRFPVFSSDQPDNVVGILLAKDLLPLLTEQSPKVDIRALMRQPLFVPESARSDQVLRMLKNTHTGYIGAEPAVMYLNGEFWGVFTIHENHDEHWQKYNYGINASVNKGFCTLYGICCNTNSSGYTKATKFVFVCIWFLCQFCNISKRN